MRRVIIPANPLLDRPTLPFRPARVAKMKSGKHFAFCIGIFAVVPEVRRKEPTILDKARDTCRAVVPLEMNQADFAGTNLCKERQDSGVAGADNAMMVAMPDDAADVLRISVIAGFAKKAKGTLQLDRLPFMHNGAARRFRVVGAPQHLRNRARSIASGADAD